MKKMNMVDKFSAIKAMLNGEKVEGFTLENALEFLDTRIELTEKKNASGGNADRKPTAKQLENEGYKSDIVDFLRTCDNPVDVKTIQKAVGLESNQRATALISQMLTIRKGEPNPDGVIVRTEVKGKAYFALAEKE